MNLPARRGLSVSSKCGKPFGLEGCSIISMEAVVEVGSIIMAMEVIWKIDSRTAEGEWSPATATAGAASKG